jgi:pyruvate, water dikinase
MTFVLPFKKISKKDISIAGGKGCNLGEMTQAGFNIPTGFVVTTAAYYDFVEIKNLKQKILDSVQKVDVNNYKKLEKAASNLKKLIHDEEIMEHIIKEINTHLKKSKATKFAVRSSATAEDLIDASFAGQQDTYLNISKKDVIKHVKMCWASLFNPRAIFYREEKRIPHDAGMAVVVQEMVDADFAGVMFTVDPIHKKHLLVEAATGLGEQVVSGEVTPNSYFLDRKSFKINQMVGDYENISDKIIQKIAKQGIVIEKHYKKPQDVEFAVKDKEIYILQSRAITTL